jgi:hypothetical protein
MVEIAVTEQQVLESKVAQQQGKRDDLHVYVCTDHDGHYPIGVASVVIARNQVDARGLLDAQLEAHGLNPNEPYTLVEIGLEGPEAVVLRDGNY